MLAIFSFLHYHDVFRFLLLKIQKITSNCFSYEILANKVEINCTQTFPDAYMYVYMVHVNVQNISQLYLIH